MATAESKVSTSSKAPTGAVDAKAEAKPRKAEHFVKKKGFFYEIFIYLYQTYWDLRGWVTWGDPVRFQPNLKKLMEFTDDLFRKHGIENEYWIDYGCLLGAVRHDRLIPWDHDLDIGVTELAYRKITELRTTEVLPTGFKWKYNEYSEYLALWYNDVWVDIVEYAEDAKNNNLKPRLHKDYDDPEDREEYCPPIAKEFILPLKKGRLWDREYPIPQDPDACLKIVYGDYWTLRFIPLFVMAFYHPFQAVGFLFGYLRTCRSRRAAITKSKR